MATVRAGGINQGLHGLVREGPRNKTNVTEMARGVVHDPCREDHRLTGDGRALVRAVDQCDAFRLRNQRPVAVMPEVRKRCFRTSRVDCGARGDTPDRPRQ